ncbi:hypothetical protein P3X46_001540 [Hevea brasiliensis]|uniref:No apical meristem-associated C-terminal domain-containing protein n=1 Tax=Hevea brasiliensis TaxID=3981 RepID=A0ABQ9NCR9_HEVBR|nr:uncharacterized protein LOC110642322 [Hevea brasiliensis]KAJ9190324.1 hypothetical protein P3X46_001540 [Hevea brasiliensis]
MAAVVAVTCSHLSNLISKFQFFSLYHLDKHKHMFSHLFFFFLSFFAFSVSFFIFLYVLYKSFNKPKREEQTQNGDTSVINRYLSKIIDGTRKNRENDATHLTHSLLLDILPSDSPKWASLFGNYPDETRSGHGNDRDGSAGDSQIAKKKKKRAKKKRVDSKSEENGGEDKGLERQSEGSDSGSGQVKPELVCLYPFTSTSSATQRKIKQQYDQLVKCNESKGLTLAQVGQFANCLIEARNELQHKSEVIKRKFTITKALLFKADRSSMDRLSQQIYKLELEQKRLEEDTFVYNWLQQQLKLSPAYEKMLEISACMELKAKSGELIENKDTEVGDISFEELLAQEKKDAFWQKNGKSRLYSSQ